MAAGQGVIIGTAVNGPYAYTWKDDPAQHDVDTVVTTKTLAAAYSEIGTLALALPGTVQTAFVTVTVNGTRAEGKIYSSAANGPYIYTWKADSTTAGFTTVVTGKTLGAAYNEIGTLANGLGAIKNATINVTSI